MTTSSPKIDAREILNQALDILRMSFWIKNNEFSWKELNSYAPMPPKWIDVQQQIISTTGRVPKGTEVNSGLVVTGVCSIGAFSLANALITKVDHPISFDELASQDLATALAGEALVRVLLGKGRGRAENIYPFESVSIITSWNDDEETTRAQVLKAFLLATKQECLEWKSLWYAKIPEIEGQFCLGFRTKSEGQDFLNSLADPKNKTRLAVEYRDTIINNQILLDEWWDAQGEGAQPTDEDYLAAATKSVAWSKFGRNP